MVRDASLWIVVGAYFSTSVTSRNHCFAFSSYIVNVFLVLLIINLRAQARESAFFILGLVSCLCTFDEYLLHFACIGVFPHITQAYTRLHFIHILSSCSTRAECFPFDFSFVDMHFKLVCFGQYGYCSGRGVYASLCLGGRYSLHAVYARLVLECAIHILSCHIEYYFFKSTCSTFGERRDSIFESMHFEVFGVHTE